jgi:hypothetical protein
MQVSDAMVEVYLFTIVCHLLKGFLAKFHILKFQIPS